MIAALGLLVGVVLGLIFTPDVPAGLDPYLPIAVVAALDAVFGALRAYLEGIFDDKVYVVSFFSNVVIAAAITPRTRGLFVNTPSNPTGWTATRTDLADLLALARRHDLWIMADEIYARYFYAGGRAPSFLDVMQPGDKLLFVNSFSKNWSMTGWRVGWIVAPPETGQVLENLIQYSTSGVAQFIQKGAVAAEPVMIPHLVGEPGLTHGPDAPGTIDRGGGAP